MEKLNTEATEIFCTILKKLGQKHSLRLSASGMLDLVVEPIGRGIETAWGKGNLYSLSTSYVQEGDLMRDPEMVFIVVDTRTTETDYLMVGIYPTMYQQDNLGLYEESVLIENNKVKSFNKANQAAHCRFANTWMQSIRAHRYLQ